MTQDPDSDQNAEHWQRKYRDSEREFAEREEQWVRLEGLFAKAVARLAVLSEGLDPELDVALGEFRQQVRDGAAGEGLHAALGQLTDVAVRVDRSTALGRATPGAELTLLLRSVQARAPAVDLSALINRAECVREADIPELCEALATQFQQSGPPRDTQVCALLISEVLYQLLERVSLPVEVNERLESLRKGLENGVEMGAWGSMLTEVSDIAADIRSKINKERGDTESFLVQVTDRLRELDGHLRGAASARAASLKDGQALNEALHAQVRGMESSVRTASDIDLLKSLVTQNLEDIRRHMENFRNAENTRHGPAEDQVKFLTERLAAMERETRALRERIQRERLQALIDPLTGIPNRLAYAERIVQEEARRRRFKHPLSLVVWDVDHFKNINDRYGHQAGDNALKTIAGLLAKKIRETDFLARYGGEEFVLLMPGADREAAANVAEKLRQVVASASFRFRGQPVSITLSGGVAEFHGHDTAESVFARADEALYQAKEQGRNRIVRAR